jgi:hypothetical protein
LNEAASQFAAEISRLIAEVEARIPAESPPRDREFHLQREVFRERAQLALNLAEQLTTRKNRQLVDEMDGDAHRIRQALELSRAYFGGHSSGGNA